MSRPPERGAGTGRRGTDDTTRRRVGAAAETSGGAR
ncbi:UNVERIFIED_ORG: hypothetical protein CLV66_102355 [Actinomadura viridilutea]